MHLVPNQDFYLMSDQQHDKQVVVKPPLSLQT